jgi:predicted RNA-binding Zn-ribbon protein involved in translation (DUF1610 family)
MNETIESENPHRVHCPACGVDVEVQSQPGSFPLCPNCGEQLVLAGEPTADPTVSDEHIAPGSEPTDNEEELNGVRIRQITTLRRGAIRARSWCLIAAGVCIVAAVQLLIEAAADIRRDHLLQLRPISFVLYAIIGIIGAVFFLRRAHVLKQEIDTTAVQRPTTPPDFSALSDGSQRWKNLDDIHK